MISGAYPVWQGNIFSDNSLVRTNEIYREIQDLGAVVWLESHGVYAIASYDECRFALRNPDIFISGKGVGLNDGCNALTQGSVIGSDKPLHPKLKSILLKRFSSETLSRLRPAMAVQADALLDRFIDAGPFDAVPDLTQAFPLGIVCDLIGIPLEDRHMLLPWAAATFDFFGPENARCLAAGPISKQAFAYAFRPDLPSRILPDSAGAEIFAAVERGELTPQQGPILMMAYLSAALDTTISSLQQALLLFSKHPDQWAMVRGKPSLISNAYEEALRLGSPARGFARVLSRDTEIAGGILKEGQRVFLLYAAANRDPRKWPDPDRFDVMRDTNGHFAFGHGVHLCAGAALARLEAIVLLGALARRVKEIEIVSMDVGVNNLIQHLRSLVISLVS